MYVIINYVIDYEHYGCKTLLSFASSLERDAWLLLCLQSKPGYLKSLKKKNIVMLLLPAPCCYFWVCYFWALVCCVPFEKSVYTLVVFCERILKMQQNFRSWLVASQYFLSISKSVSNLWVDEIHMSLAQPPRLPSVWASWISRKFKLLRSVLWWLLFQREANVFWWVTGHCSLQTSCQEVESDKADGLYKNSFPLQPVLFSCSLWIIKCKVLPNSQFPRQN